jgi:ABC-type antimicrobial peptide transport system permease subunit
MTIIATAIGFALSPLVYRMLGESLVQEAAAGGVNWTYLLIGALAAMAFSLLFGVYPARQAGRIDAAVAIRSE